MKTLAVSVVSAFVFWFGLSFLMGVGELVEKGKVYATASKK
jgi:hypothetical protein